MLPMASCLPAFFRRETSRLRLRLRRDRLRLRRGFGEAGSAFAEASARQVFALIESFPAGFAAASAAPH
jgi:hypothetical protein